MFSSDYEHVILCVILLALFLIGLKRKKEKKRELVLDKNFSSVLKGIACIFILMGHYESTMHYPLDYYPKCLGWFVRLTTANVALVWFMFISGYGLTISKSKIDAPLYDLGRRCGKVFFPMLFVFLSSLFLFVILPEKANMSCPGDLLIPEELHMFNGKQDFEILKLFYAPIDWYWYVWCILIFYCCFYFSLFFSRKYNINTTILLIVLLGLYYTCAYILLGVSWGHYYRLTWAFLFGHLFAKRHELSLCITGLGLFLGGITFYVEDYIMILNFIISILIILLLSCLNKKYEYKGKSLLFLGTISYFYYLSHRRICWVLCCYLNIYDLLFWVLLTILVSYILYWFYNNSDVVKNLYGQYVCK